jgi:hypothetical protein
MKRNEAHAHEGTQKIALMAPKGTNHGDVELWFSAERNSFVLKGYHPTEGAARRAAEANGKGTYYLTTGPGQLLLRMELGDGN